MRMSVYIIRRLILLIPIIIGVMTITFVLISAIPTTQRIESYYAPCRGHCFQPWQEYIPCPTNATQTCTNPLWTKAIDALGLNQPVPVQWALYMENALTFHWGYTNNFSSAVTNNPTLRGQEVTTVLGWFLPYTLELAILSLILIVAISLPLGNLSAVYRNRPVDQISRVMSFSGFALPAFLLGTLFLYAVVISVGGASGTSPICGGHFPALDDFWGSWPAPGCTALYGANVGPLGYPTWLGSGFVSSPTGFPTIDAAIHGDWALSADTLLRLVLPALVIAYGTIAVLLRFVRNSMLEVMNLDFVRTARAKGLSEHVVTRRHAGRNSLNVTITVLGLTFAFFISGFPIIESVFNLWGVGRLLALSLEGSFDYGLIFGSTLLFTFLVVGANIVVDVLYAYLDPRVRLG
jgi:ABC-type dipeptide/oligopeptide/nickel transport system permease component